MHGRQPPTDVPPQPEQKGELRVGQVGVEDAGNFLQDALHKSVLTALTTQMNGYYDLVPRAVTEVAVVFPLRWTPGIMAACAALQYATSAPWPAMARMPRAATKTIPTRWSAVDRFMFLPNKIIEGLRWRLGIKL